jgi:basic membrane protein A
MNIKKILGLFCITLLMACGNNNNTANQFKVIQVTEAGGVSDGSFNQNIYEGISDFFAENSAVGSYDYMIADSLDSLSITVKAAADSLNDGDVIVTGGFNFEAVINEVAPLYPNLYFILVDGQVDLPNVQSIKYNEFAAGRLAGVATASTALNGGLNNAVFGIIKGMDVPAVVAYHDGFVSGVTELMPNARFEAITLNSWTDTGRAKSFSLMLRNNHGDNLFAILTSAGEANKGAIALATEMYSAGQQLFIIGVDTDMFAMGKVGDNSSVVLTSALKLCSVDIVSSLTNIKAGNFVAGLIEGSVGYAFSNPLLVRVLA